MMNIQEDISLREERERMSNISADLQDVEKIIVLDYGSQF